MFKFSFKPLLKSILVMFFGFVFTTNAFGTPGAITGNDSFGSAHSIGYWEYHSSTVAKLEVTKNQSDSYFSFRVKKGDRVYVRISLGKEYLNSGVNLQIFDSNQSPKTPVETTVTNFDGLSGFIFQNIDAESDSQTFYIKVNKGSYIGDIVFSVSVNKRIYSNIATFDFTGTASNPGNPNFLNNPSGVDSSVISMDLRNKTTIPNGAIVKSITTAGNISSGKGALIYKISSNQNSSIWYQSTTQMDYNISLNDKLEVKKIWSFKYNQKSAGASNMSKVKATINYEYDITKNNFK
ncbi:hypothetical protein PJV93_11355 [Aliarcobacter butzleri]|uniref:Uncharacterized protein n=1 Tax=Aliarcobacter butzleri TaxID=28197 RepID=A0AAW7QF43_9BACT|nr:hypothetical protein [Aliarcobacter butzleri]MDN5108095.1 hypothetical protein [Aliarcobacter butzleri]MDN5124504.1 hypothetical protein [Aliarcobacter butzleri]